MPDVAERALDAAVAPAAVLSREVDDELPDLLQQARPPYALPRVRPLGCYQLPVPAEDRVWSHDRGDLHQEPSSASLARGRPSPSLLIIPSKRPSLELLLQHSSLLSQMLQALELAADDPACERRNQELQRVNLGHTSHSHNRASSVGVMRCRSARFAHLTPLEQYQGVYTIRRAGDGGGDPAQDYWNVIERPSVKLEVGTPATLSRNQHWKFQVSPASTEWEPPGRGRSVRSRSRTSSPAVPVSAMSLA